MRIGVISDTHGHVENTQAAVRMLQSLKIEAVLHAGDIGSPQIPKVLTQWPAHFVLATAITTRINCGPPFRKPASLATAVSAISLWAAGASRLFTVTTPGSFTAFAPLATMTSSATATRT